MAAGIPGDVPTDCPGTNSERAGTAKACEGCPNQKTCATSKTSGPDPDLASIASRLAGVRNIVLILSGKGGVGKSTVSTQVALSLAAKGHEVGLLDIDICGPSTPRMLGLENEEIHQSASGWQPVYYTENLAVMSIGFMLSSPDDAIVWRGPKKTSMIKSFLKDVEWGELDYLIVDSPPGVRNWNLFRRSPTHAHSRSLRASLSSFLSLRIAHRLPSYDRPPTSIFRSSNTCCTVGTLRER